MSHARRTLRISDAVTRTVVASYEEPPLWHVGELVSENGRDIEFKQVAAGLVSGPIVPRPVRPSGDDPDEALRRRARVTV